MVKAIVGGNWGDEGKGKMTDLLAEVSDVVVRFQGGANAGHTILNGYGRFVLHMLPSGVFHPGVANVIGPGVAFNPEKFFQDLDALKAGGVPEPPILVSDRAQLVLPYHVLFDAWEEERLGAGGFGSTRAGIAPFYSDKYLKIGLRVSDLYDEPELREKLQRILEVKAIQAKAVYGHADFPGIDLLMERLDADRARLAPYVRDTTRFLRDAERSGKAILLEGQLGALRDPDHGIYPFVTSSSPLSGYASVGAGIPAQAIREVVTVVKAYSSCVGAGPFPVELFDEEGENLRRRGGDRGEYGASTGRPRRVGFFDLVASRYGCMLQGTTGVALSLIDVLGYLDEIPVCVRYELDGRETDEFPVTPLLQRARPVYETLPGWKRDIRGIRRYEDLPPEARGYVEFIEERLGYPITMISNGPERDAVILR